MIHAASMQEEVIARHHGEYGGKETGKSLRDNLDVFMGLGPILIQEAGGQISDRMIIDLLPPEAKGALESGMRDVMDIPLVPRR
jgi:hypothetical protein